MSKKQDLLIAEVLADEIREHSVEGSLELGELLRLAKKIASTKQGDEFLSFLLGADSFEEWLLRVQEDVESLDSIEDMFKRKIVDSSFSDDEELDDDDEEI